VTGSPFALVFAFLGPVIAVASLLDARVQNRRAVRRERRRFDSELAAAAAGIERFHREERAAHERQAPAATEILSSTQSDPERWRSEHGSSLRVRIGRGRIRSGLEVVDHAGGRPPDGAGPGEDAVEAALSALAAQAADLADAPVVVDAELGIGICGPRAPATAMVRALIVQLAHGCSPASTAVHAVGNCPPEAGRRCDRPGSVSARPDWACVEGLPHHRPAPPAAALSAAALPAAAIALADTTSAVRERMFPPSYAAAAGSAADAAPDSGADPASGPAAVQFLVGDPRRPDLPVRRIILAVADSAAALPRECRIVIRIGDGGTAHLIRHPSRELIGPLLPEFISEEQAAAFARTLTHCAIAEGIGDSRVLLPSFVPLRQALSGGLDSGLDGGLDADPYPTDGRDDGRRGTLDCPIGVTTSGVCRLDLVRDGPHAVIGGTTGSGKSELLISWLLAMAFGYSPERVSFLLVDFKGGSSFAALQRLPHTLGLITDLDEQSAARALSSLRAELRHRERVLAEAGVRSIDELTVAQAALPRLVIVVDEFAAMVAGFPELHALFADIASRGRSLGMHVILCTQRPAGAVRDMVLANCGLRLSLRVNNAADSTAVIGSAAAAGLVPVPIGRCLVSIAGQEPQLLQVALAADGDAGRICDRWLGRPIAPGRRPWCDPLPARLALGDLPEAESGIVFGLMDLPDEQRQCAAVYDPRTDGNLLVLGGHGSGKTTLLRTVLTVAGAGAATLVPAEPEDAWDAVTGAAEHPGGDADRRLLLIDDLDALLMRFGEEHRQRFVELLGELLRDGGGSNLQVVAAVKGVPGSLHTLAALCDSRLILRLPSRQEHLMAGGNAADYSSDLPPGGGYWHGRRIQAADSPAMPPRAERPVQEVELQAGRGYAVVSQHPKEFIRRLEAAHAPDRGRRAAAGLTVVELGPPTGPGERGVAGAPIVGTDTATVVIARAEVWQTHWGLIETLRASMPVIFDGCGVREFQTLTRLHSVPPPLASNAKRLWMLDLDGSIRRLRLP
ncbi:MAG: FtsK/SpoIIIE domain-containing protein, partial [Microbacteriaceae bacterium]